ncbi:MAG: hypothetical protein GF408_03140, partial [Candidatus Omnitrophica bacterium]|nr:hypothetical protein [Candidatus Omnitrophota bacterium]
MTVKFVRSFFIVLSVICGYYLGDLFPGFGQQGPFIGMALGLIGSALLIIFEIKLKQVSLRNLSAAVFGLFFGFFMAWILTLIARIIPMDEI